jgi:RHS repeat-associated protein
MAGISSKAAGKLENRFKYNGIEIDEDLSLNAYEAHYRMLDPSIGRWWQIDPKIEEGYESWSPYNSMANDPVKMSDPLGDVPDITIIGADNSSVTITTDLVDLKVDVGFLGINFGGNYTIGGDDILQAGLDLAGIADPTGMADGINAGISIKKGNWWDAAISGLGLLPYVGDLGKLGKVKKDVRIIEEGIEAVSKTEKRAAKLSEVSREGKDFTKAGKDAVKDVNKAKNEGKMRCANCKEELQQASKHEKGKKPPSNEAHVDHKKPKSKAGSGTPDNGQVLCRGCNVKKGAKIEPNN